MLRFFQLLAAVFLCNVLLMLQSYADKVLIVTWQGKQQSEKVFERSLKELRPDVSFVYIDARRSKFTLASRLRAFDISDIDLVYSYGTNCTAFVKEFLKRRKPHVFNIVSMPALSRIANSLRRPGNNLTGARLLPSVGTQLDVITRLKKIKSLAVWFDPREKQNSVVLKRLREVAAERNIKIEAIRLIPDAKGFQKALVRASEHAESMDAVYVVASSSYFAKAQELVSKLKPETFVVSTVTWFVELGMPIVVGADIVERSQTVAQQAHDILNGASAGDIPVSVVSPENTYVYVNKKKIRGVISQNRIKQLGDKVRVIASKQD